MVCALFVSEKLRHVLAEEADVIVLAMPLHGATDDAAMDLLLLWRYTPVSVERQASFAFCKEQRGVKVGDIFRSGNRGFCFRQINPGHLFQTLQPVCFRLIDPSRVTGVDQLRLVGEILVVMQLPGLVEPVGEEAAWTRDRVMRVEQRQGRAVGEVNTGLVVVGRRRPQGPDAAGRGAVVQQYGKTSFVLTLYAGGG